MPDFHWRTNDSWGYKEHECNYKHGVPEEDCETVYDGVDSTWAEIKEPSENRKTFSLSVSSDCVIFKSEYKTFAEAKAFAEILLKASFTRPSGWTCNPGNEKVFTTYRLSKKTEEVMIIEVPDQGFFLFSCNHFNQLVPFEERQARFNNLVDAQTAGVALLEHTLTLQYEEEDKEAQEKSLLKEKRENLLKEILGDTIK